MTMISLSDKIGSLRHFLIHAALFGAVVTVGYLPRSMKLRNTPMTTPVI